MIASFSAAKAAHQQLWSLSPKEKIQKTLGNVSVNSIKAVRGATVAMIGAGALIKFVHDLYNGHTPSYLQSAGPVALILAVKAGGDSLIALKKSLEFNALKDNQVSK